MVPSSGFIVERLAYETLVGGIYKSTRPHVPQYFVVLFMAPAHVY